jgi:hypothetical protein
MRASSTRELFVSLALCVVLGDAAVAQVYGRATDRCRSPLDLEDDATGAEVYTVRISRSNPSTYSDYGFDLTSKGGSATPALCDLSGSTWVRPANDREFDWQWVDVFVFVTLPPLGPGEPGRLLVDSGRADTLYARETTWHEVGSGDGWTTAPRRPRAVPARSGRDDGLAAVHVEFGAVAEVNATELARECTIGGDSWIWDSATRTRHGLLSGYNVYRLPGAGGSPPDTTAYLAPDAWQYFVPLGSFLEAADATGLSMPQREGMPPATAASDLAPNDLAGMQNPDGTFFTGDELLLFQDSPALPDGSPRDSLHGTAPRVDNGYWYSVQPVISVGSLSNSAFDGIGFTNNLVFVGDHVMTLGNGVQGIDMDLDGRPEFYNPQVAAGIQGLGLTNADLPLLSAPFFVDTTSVLLPAVEQVALTAWLDARPPRLVLSVGLEGTDVLGYDVWRLTDTGRSRVNANFLRAEGAEAATYEIVDPVLAARRSTRRTSWPRYEVEVLRTDGTATVPGPFDPMTPLGTTSRRTQ